MSEMVNTRFLKVVTLKNGLRVVLRLRHAGSIGHDADLVLLLHRPWVYDQKEEKDAAEVIAARNRGGPTGSISLRFTAEHVRFDDIGK